jgi:hypothetical protein
VSEHNPELEGHFKSHYEIHTQAHLQALARQAEPPEPVTESQYRVLQALLRNAERLLKNRDLEAAAELSDKTLGRDIEVLLARGLVHRPGGKRQGLAITPRGLALVQKTGPAA